MAKRPANRKKVWAMCFQCDCNRWIFARLGSDAPSLAGHKLLCPKCKRSHSVRESALSLRRIPIEHSKSSKRPPKRATAD